MVLSFLFDAQLFLRCLWLCRTDSIVINPTRFLTPLPLSGGVSAEEMVARRKAKLDADGIKGLLKE